MRVEKFIVFCSLHFSIAAYAAMPENAYIEALKSAERKVLRLKKLQESSSSALSADTIQLMYGRFYRPGDSWDVASWYFDGSKLNHPPSSMKLSRTETRSGLPSSHSPASVPVESMPIAKQGIFHYEVTNIKSGTHPQVQLKVTQIEKLGMKITDPQVKALQLTMTDGISQSEKSYLLANAGENRERWVKVSADSLHTQISPLELFPLDIPDIMTAEKKSDFRFPELPSPVRNFYESFGSPPQLSQSSWFEQDDFFGRPIQVLWQKGDPWPTYLKTSNGISILIRKGAV